MSGDRVDFFISHAAADRAWAGWVAWQLDDAGYTVELDVWDWAAGQHFVTAMSDALDRCDRVVALFSTAYFDKSRYTTEEWTAAVVHAPGRKENRLVPVRVEEVPVEAIPAVLRVLVARDLFGIPEDQARRSLLEAVAGPRRPDHKPVFPGHGTPGTLSKLDVSGPQLPESVPPERKPASVAPGRIFISYRRDDTAYPSGWLFDKLAQHFGQDQVFKDIDSIQLGDDFADEITAAVERCDVLLALIGRRWLTVGDEKGRRRLDNLNDFVRLEIEAAIKRNVRIIPILVEGAPIPRADELPRSLAKLARLQALELSPNHFSFDISRLLRVLDATITSAQAPPVDSE